MVFFDLPTSLDGLGPCLLRDAVSSSDRPVSSYHEDRRLSGSLRVSRWFPPSPPSSCCRSTSASTAAGLHPTSGGTRSPTASRAPRGAGLRPQLSPRPPPTAVRTSHPAPNPTPRPCDGWGQRAQRTGLPCRDPTAPPAPQWPSAWPGPATPTPTSPAGPLTAPSCPPPDGPPPAWPSPATAARQPRGHSPVRRRPCGPDPGCRPSGPLQRAPSRP